MRVLTRQTCTRPAVEIYRYGEQRIVRYLFVLCMSTKASKSPRRTGHVTCDTITHPSRDPRVYCHSKLLATLLVSIFLGLFPAPMSDPHEPHGFKANSSLTNKTFPFPNQPTMHTRPEQAQNFFHFPSVAQRAKNNAREPSARPSHPQHRIFSLSNNFTTPQRHKVKPEPTSRQPFFFPVSGLHLLIYSFSYRISRLLSQQSPHIPI